MGKNRQAQRTKNNAQPSNSSRSAELLGTAIPFVGFSAASQVKDGGYVPVLPGLCFSNNVEINSVDPTFQVALKKMNKKDARTRHKALQEFTSLCQTAELSAVESILPFWPRIYLVVAIDIEDRVREAAQLAHSALVDCVGKKIDNFLNQLIGTWFTSQFDSSPVAASTASYSFAKIFPPSKLLRIVRYQNDILNHISHILFKADSFSVSPQTFLNYEEKSQIYSRLLATNMQAYSFYFRKVPRQEIDKTVEIHNKILSSFRFWNLYSQHDLLSVRIAFFNVLSSVLENAEHLLENEKRRTITAIINRLGCEMDTKVVSAIWESMLLAMTKLTDWHLVVDVKEFVLPKVWRSMGYGGDGCASTAYPNLLPFVSQFPKLSDDVRSLYGPFFSCLREGFSANKVRKNCSETQAVAQAFVECLRYSIHVNAKDVDLCIWLFKEHLMPVLAQACFCTTNEYMCNTFNINVYMKQVCFTEIALLVRHWSRSRSNGEHKKSYAALMREFWIELRQWFELKYWNPGKLNKNYQIEFLLTLKNPPNRVCKKSKVVRFSNSDSDPVPSQPETRVVDTDATFNSELCEFVSVICKIYFDKIIADYQQCWPISPRVLERIRRVNTLLRHFASRELFTVSTFLDSNDQNFFKFYDKNLKPLVLQNSKEVMEQSLELIFYLIPHMDDAEKDKVLKSLTNLNDIRITRNVIYRCLFERNRNDHVIRNWYKQADIIKLLIDVAAEIVLSEDEDCSNLENNRNLILLAFETSETGELLISEDGANKIVSILCDSLSGRDDVCSAKFVEFVAELMTSTWNHKNTISNAVQILETMFELCTREHDDRHTTTLETARKCWREGFVRSAQLLPADKFNDLVEKCAIIIWSKVYNEGHTKDTLVDLATDIFEIAIDVGRDDTAKSSSRCTEKTILLFLTSSDIKLSVAEATAVAIYGEIVTGNLYVSNLERKIRIFGDHTLINIASDNAILNNMTNCLCWALFTTDLLNNLYERLRSDKSTDAEETSESEEDYDLNVPGITELLMNIIYVASVKEIYSKHYKSTKSYNDVNKLFELFNISLITLRKYYAKNIRDDVSSHLQTNRSSYGYMLPYMIHTYCTKFELSGVNDVARYYKNCTSGAEENEEARLQASQILGDYWDMETLSTNDITHSSIVARTAMCRKNVIPDIAAKHCDLTTIMSRHKDDPALLLLDCEVFDVPWSRLLLPLEVVRLLATLVRKTPSVLESEHWDFILLSLAVWQQSIKKSIYNYTDIRVTSLITAVGQLYCSIQTLMNNPIPELSPALLDEWTKVFASDVQSVVAQTWMHCVDLHDHDDTDVRSTVLLDQLGKTISVLDGDVLFKTDEKRVNVVDFDSMLQLSLKLLQSPVSSVQLGAYHALKCMVSKLKQCDTKIVESDSIRFERSSLYFKKLEDVLLSTQNIVNTMLMDFKLCDTISCTIEPFTDSYTYALGYLLTWAIVLDMCKCAHDDLRYHYAEMVKNHLFPSLLKNIFKLMPMEVLQGIKNKNDKLLKMFTTEPSLNFGESWTELRLDHIVCWVYTNCLRCLPVLVRQWLNTADSKVSATVDKITSYYISPMLCQERLHDQRLKKYENLKVNMYQSTRQIVGIYKMEETKLELVIVLPLNYPLGAVEVQNNACSANFTNSFSQLAIFLTHQNGDIWEGLLMWKRILDKKFASVDECCICYSILHHNTHQIPKLSCNVCHKKYHTSCLYQWFNTSQKSTCPNCRNVF
ncbi:E3 ubiquitin-protein ligase listerin [Pseudomyrmex gracilis]|uniref:E3 ubiquitin-protein ligase listerin n=1 Tax=Pseudomyrmex gracilis TaxID=219809 RepID=UPI0009950164|nr:E3 ubiquitin-protein ligase listerin [Pseudomyrmex gracilis]